MNYDMRRGQTPVYDDPEVLLEKIIEYFESLKPIPMIHEGYAVLHPKTEQPIYEKCELPSVVGMALFLGFASRQSIYDYAKKESFSYIVTRAKSTVEKGVLDLGMREEIPHQLAKFLLAQFGYSEKVVTKEDTNDDKSLLRQLIDS